MASTRMIKPKVKTNSHMRNKNFNKKNNFKNSVDIDNSRQMKIKLDIGHDSRDQKTAIKTVLTKLFSKWSKVKKKEYQNINPHLKKQLKQST